MSRIFTDEWLNARVDRHSASIIERFTSDIPVKVGALAVELGLDVKKAPLDPRISGLIQPSATSISKFEIKVNKYEVPERQRFTVAHEIGHYLLHKEDIGSGVVDNILYRSGLTSRKEVEANRLAADIIMPSLAISRELRKLGGLLNLDTVDQLSILFKVSVPAMKIRLGVPL